MVSTRFPVDVLMRRIALRNRWASERWAPLAVVPLEAETVTDPDRPTADPRLVADGPEGSVWCFTGYALELFPSEGEGYFLNLTSPDPAVFVMWRPDESSAGPAIRPSVVTVSYNEAARMLDVGEAVEPVSMPAVVRAWVEPYMHAHYQPGPRQKVRRNDPFADDARGPDRPRRR